MPTFRCSGCERPFDLPQHVLDRYPGWTPSQCRECRKGTKANSRASSPAHTPPPGDAVYTDGGCEPNPGPGGWGAVWVRDDTVIEERSGHDPDTTNNRMELRALIEAVRMLPEGTPATIFSDSNLAVQTINAWAKGWKARGWKRKTGPVQNLDLVRELYELFESRPDLRLEWIKAHVGHRWNERADALTRAWKDS